MRASLDASAIGSQCTGRAARENGAETTAHKRCKSLLVSCAFDVYSSGRGKGQARHKTKSYLWHGMRVSRQRPLPLRASPSHQMANKQQTISDSLRCSAFPGSHVFQRDQITNKQDEDDPRRLQWPGLIACRWALTGGDHGNHLPVRSTFARLSLWALRVPEETPPAGKSSQTWHIL